MKTLESIIKSGKKIIVIGLASTLLGLTSYCGPSGGGGRPTPILNNPPVAVAEFSLSNPSNQYHPTYVHPNNIVTLKGDNSYDPDGDVLTYSWKLFNKPPTSTLINIFSSDTPYQQFIPDVTGDYELELKVSDGRIASYDYIIVNALDNNNAPFANAGEDKLGNIPVEFTFNGSYSTDGLYGRITSCYWDFGDGITYSETPTSAPDRIFDCITKHTYTFALNPGDFTPDFTVNFTVTDDDNVQNSDIADVYL